MNPIHEAERAEYRAALASMTEMEYAATEPDRPDIYGWNPEDNL